MTAMIAPLEISIATGFISREADLPSIAHNLMTTASRASPIDTKKLTSIPQISISKTLPLSREREAILSEHTQSNNNEAVPRRANPASSKPHQAKQTLPQQPTPPNKSVVKNRHRQ